MQRTLDEIRDEGLKALRERLGRADMIRFLQQFETGSGDFARERREWVDSLTLEDLEREAGLGQREDFERYLSAAPDIPPSEQDRKD
jgi:hypothetical protein